MRKFLLTPKRGSRGGSLLARSLEVAKLAGKRLAGYTPDPADIIINWGNTSPPEKTLGCRMLNRPEAIVKAVNKLTTLGILSGTEVKIPDHTTDQAVAMTWVRGGLKVVARHTLTGSGGDGIQILSSLDDFPCEAPLYTLYIPKTSEYRVHVMSGKVFDVQKKARRKDIPNDKVNWQIRNHDNGFIFAREGVNKDEPEVMAVEERAVQAVNILGLDFGAVDVIWNKKHETPYVLEVNTAPGIEGTTLYNYCEAFIDLFYRMGHNGFKKAAMLNGAKKLPPFVMPDFLFEGLRVQKV